MTLVSKTAWRCVLLCCLLTAVASNAAEPIKLVASINPLGLIASDVLGESGDVSVLVPPNLSPHDYALKASDVKRLYQADLVFWLGPQLEQFLVKPIRNLDQKRVLTINEKLNSEGHHQDASHGDHHHADAHAWLDPARATAMMLSLVDRLITQTPAIRSELESRRPGLIQAYDAIDRRLAEDFAAVRNVGFVVYHPGYDALVEHYGLTQIGWVSVTPEQPPGLRHLVELEQAVKSAREQQPVNCLFVEAGHHKPSVDNIAAQLDLRVVALDILGSAPTLAGYGDMMTALATTMVDCLSSQQ